MHTSHKSIGRSWMVPKDAGKMDDLRKGEALSQLLSNIMLNELDKELECRGHRFVHYVDDCAPRRRVQVAQTLDDSYIVQMMAEDPPELLCR